MTTNKKSPQVFIVEASAGSGKTYALARRYLHLLINPDLKIQEIPLKTILAITFTNKAAIEMKERILEFLKDIAFDQFRNPGEKKELLSYLDVDMQYAKSKAHLIMDEIIKNYNFFQVQTIDSFINAILSGCAFRLNLSAHFRIKKEYKEYLAYSLDKLIDRAAQDKKVMELFDEYLKQYLYLENKAGWFPKRDILSIISGLFDDSNVYGAPFKKYVLKDKNEIFLRRRKIIQLMQELRDSEPAGVNQTTFKAFKNKLEKCQDSLDIEEISPVFITEELPIRKNHTAPSEINKLWTRIRKEIGGLFETEALALFNCYIDIFNLVYEDLRKVTSREDVVFLTELNRKARILFDEQAITVPELYYRLATRFHHYLIDEFQDTSSLQWRNLLPMVEEALSKGGSLFYVGDKKQAVFRFRGGDTSLFDNVKLSFSSFPNLHNYLKDNYRSLKEIVEFNNTVFSQDNLKRFLQEREDFKKNKDPAVSFNADDMEDILSVFFGATQNIKKTGGSGYVKIERVLIDTKEESDEIIKANLINLIRELKSRYVEYKNIAVLCRRNQDIEEITSWLLQEHIPVESEKTLNIREYPLIKEIVSFLKFLNSPIDNLSFASFILGDVFLKAANFKKEEISIFIFNLHRNKNRNDDTVYLYRSFRKQFPKVWDELIDEFFKNVGFVPLYELVVSILGKFRIPERFPETQGFIMRFLELIKKQVNEENVSLSSFLDYFEAAVNEELYVNVAETDAVKIMSIHKAKGLEFSVVIIPFLEIDAAVSSGRDRKPYVLYPSDGFLKLLKLGKAYLPFSGFLEKIYRSGYKRSLIDELNSVYVAFTRAKLELYAFIPKKSANSFNLANFLIPDGLIEMGKKIQPGGVKEIPAKTIIPPSEYKNWIPYLKEEFIDKSQIENRNKLLEGEIMHAILSYIGNLAEQDKDSAISFGLHNARFLFPQVSDFQKFENTAVKLLNATHLQPFFYVKEADVYREKEVVDKSGQTKRMDRLIVKKSEIIIIDYKSIKIENEDYRNQMLDYISLIKDLFPGRSVAGYLLYLDNLSLEEVHG